MGVEIMMATVAVAKVAQIGTEITAADAAKQTIELNQKKNNLEIEQQKLKTADTLQKVTSRQIAESTVRGIDASLSPSFNAIQRDTFNQAQTDFNNLAIEKNLLNESARIEKQNVNSKLWSKLFGDVSMGAMEFAKFKRT